MLCRILCRVDRRSAFLASFSRFFDSPWWVERRAAMPSVANAKPRHPSNLSGGASKITVVESRSASQRDFLPRLQKACIAGLSLNVDTVYRHYRMRTLALLAITTANAPAGEIVTGQATAVQPAAATS